jgi:Nucleoside-diphosphate-sugar epimerases
MINEILKKGGSMERVLVTGATGFIGLHCIQQLLEQGYGVNGTLRSMQRESEVRQSLEKHNTSCGNLSLFPVDLMSDEGGMMPCQL